MSSPVRRPEVANPELRAALDKVGAQIENYRQNLDHISNDIRVLEEYLTASGIRQWACVVIGRTDEFTDGDYDVGGNYSGGIVRYNERIKWSATGAEDSRWRLMYEKVCRNGQIEICERVAMEGPTFTGALTLVEEKPLIETPVAMRLQAHRYLADLVVKIGKLVEFTPVVLPQSGADAASGSVGDSDSTDAVSDPMEAE